MELADELELELRRLADELAVLRAGLLTILAALPQPPDKTPERRAA